jgi:hypothetical protein
LLQQQTTFFGTGNKVLGNRERFVILSNRGVEVTLFRDSFRLTVYGIDSLLKCLLLFWTESRTRLESHKVGRVGLLLHGRLVFSGWVTAEIKRLNLRLCSRGKQPEN